MIVEQHEIVFFINWTLWMNIWMIHRYFKINLKSDCFIKYSNPSAELILLWGRASLWKSILQMCFHISHQKEIKTEYMYLLKSYIQSHRTLESESDNWEWSKILNSFRVRSSKEGKTRGSFLKLDLELWFQNRRNNKITFCLGFALHRQKSLASKGCAWIQSLAIPSVKGEQHQRRLMFWTNQNSELRGGGSPQTTLPSCFSHCKCPVETELIIFSLCFGLLSFCPNNYLIILNLSVGLLFFWYVHDGHEPSFFRSARTS